MKKRAVMLLIALSCVTLAMGCGKKEEPAAEPVVETTEEPVIEIGTAEEEPEVEEEAPEEEEEEVREGYYRSELTNEWIDESLMKQRPIAAMVDNERDALPHFGINKCDIVYEMTNSTANGGITRLMCIYKDWGNVEQLGSIRSVRPTHLQIAPEYNAVVCHDGGPFYIDAYMKNIFVKHFSGTFSRVNNGKSREFTEYILPGDLEKNFKNQGISTEYDEYYMANDTEKYEGHKKYDGDYAQHFKFASEKKPVDLSDNAKAEDATDIKLPFDHNSSELKYDEANGVYLYSEYGSAHVDAGDNNTQTSFKNVIIQCAELTQFDDNGYMMYTSVAEDQDGWYVTNGKVIPIKWTKPYDTYFTQYYDLDGNEITINTGKTYIALVRTEDFGEITFK